MFFDLFSLGLLRSVSVQVDDLEPLYGDCDYFDFSKTSLASFLRLLASATSTSNLESATLVMDLPRLHFRMYHMRLGPEIIHWLEVQNVVDDLRWENDRKNLLIVIPVRNLCWRMEQLEAVLAHHQTRGITIEDYTRESWHRKEDIFI
jgi:hypothetical protein